MRIVLDTNVLIAAFIARGVCHDLLEHCALKHELITSDFILNEDKEKLSDKFNYPAELVEEVDILLRSRMQHVKPANLDAPICRDPDDDNILASALAGNCECIVTGDKDLLVLEQFKGNRIVSPRGFESFESSLE